MTNSMRCCLKWPHIPIILLFFPIAFSQEQQKQQAVPSHFQELNLKGVHGYKLVLKPHENSGFAFMDNSRKQHTAISIWDSGLYSFVLNGGYFEKDFSSEGFYKLNGIMIQKKIRPERSGMLIIAPDGCLSIEHREDVDLNEAYSVLQSGPFVIDPGGKIGIYGRAPSDEPANRTLIGMAWNGDIIILVFEKVRLFDLARLIHFQFPEIERLLNLDGGPSTALVSKAVRVGHPQTRVRNYIVKTQHQ